MYIINTKGKEFIKQVGDSLADCGRISFLVIFTSDISNEQEFKSWLKQELTPQSDQYTELVMLVSQPAPGQSKFKH